MWGLSFQDELQNYRKVNKLAVLYDPEEAHNM